ncbi:MAG: serine/threonine-protein kinase [Chloroflexota bacterium]
MSSGERQATWSFQPGTVVGDGRTAIRLLGGGDRYEAWLGWDEHLHSRVVLKLLRPDQVHRPRARAAIARESKTLLRLAHPGIVRCFAAELDGERPHLVLEFLDGPRLSTLVRRTGVLAAEQLVPLAVEIGSALAYLHNEQQLHLDVKPQNVIMGAPPRLIDLSIARRFEEVASLTGPLGTDAYMAPEQCDEQQLSRIGPWTDVWGLGATLYEAVNGYRPFRKRRNDEPHAQLTEDPAPFHPHVPPVMRSAIAACLTRDLDARPPVPEVMETFDAFQPAARQIAMRRIRRRVR